MLGALHTAYDHEVAGWFLQEAAHPPTDDQEQQEFRAKWFPWLAGRAPGPVRPRGDRRWDKDWPRGHD